MAYPNYTTPRSLAGAATPTYLSAVLASGYSAGQTLQLANTAGWYEVSSSGTATTNPLGTSGVFTLVVDYGLGTEEKILCASGAISIGTNALITVWTDGTNNGRGWDGTSSVAHAIGTTSGFNVFPVRTAVDDLQFNTSAITLTNEITTLSGQYVVTSGIVTTTTANVAALSGSLATLSGQYATTSGVVTTQSGYIATISGKQVTDEANIASLSGSLATLSGQYVTTSGIVTGHTGSIASISGSLNTLSGQFVALSGAYAVTSGNLNTTNSNLSTLSGQFVTLSGAYATTSGSLNTVSGVAYSALQRSGGTISGALNITSPIIGGVTATSGQSLVWNNTQWVPATVSGGGGGITSLTGDVTATGTGAVAATLVGTTAVSGVVNTIINVNPTVTGTVANLATLSGQFVTLSGQYNTTSGIVTGQTSSIALISGNLNTVSGVAYAALPGSGGTISGNLAIASGLTVSGALSVASEIDSGAMTIGGNLTVTGTSTHIGNATFSGTVTIGGNNVMTSGYTAGGDLSGTYPNPTLAATTNVESIISANTTVAGALQKSGGTMTGAITGTSITLTGEDVASDFNATGIGNATAGARFVGGTTSGPPTQGTYLVGDYVIDHTSTIWSCVAASATYTVTNSVGHTTYVTYTTSGGTAPKAGSYVTITGMGANNATGGLVASSNGTNTFAVNLASTTTVTATGSAVTTGNWSPTESQSIATRSAAATAALGEVSICTGSTPFTITLPTSPVSGSQYSIINNSSATITLSGSMSAQKTTYTTYTVDPGEAYGWVYDGTSYWYNTWTTDITNMIGVLPVANGGTGSATGALPLTGDVTGTATASVVGAIQGKSISSTQATLLSQTNNFVTHTSTSNPTITAGETSLVTTLTGTLTLTLPSGTANGTTNNISLNSSLYTVTVSGSGTDKIQINASQVSSVALPTWYNSFSCIYYNGVWYPTSGPWAGQTGTGTVVYSTNPAITAPVLTAPQIVGAFSTALSTSAVAPSSGTPISVTNTNGPYFAYTSNPTGPYPINYATYRGAANGYATTANFAVNNGATAYLPSSISIDGYQLAASGSTASLPTNGQTSPTSYTVTAASGNGTSVTYTCANSLIGGATVNITGLGIASGSSLNLTNVQVFASTANNFTVLNTTVGVSSGTGTATPVRSFTTYYQGGTQWASADPSTWATYTITVINTAANNSVVFLSKTAAGAGLPITQGGTGSTTAISGFNNLAISGGTVGGNLVAASGLTVSGALTQIGNASFSGTLTVASAIINPILQGAYEVVSYSGSTVLSGTATPATLNAANSSFYFYNTAPSGSYTVAITGAPTVSGVSATFALLVNNGSTAYLPSNVTINGNQAGASSSALPLQGATNNGITTYYQGGTAWSSADANTLDSYTFTVICTSNTPTWTLLAGLTKF